MVTEKRVGKGNHQRLKPGKTYFTCYKKQTIYLNFCIVEVQLKYARAYLFPLQIQNPSSLEIAYSQKLLNLDHIKFLALAGDCSRHIKIHSVKEKEEQKAKLNQIEDQRERGQIFGKSTIPCTSWHYLIPKYQISACGKVCEINNLSSLSSFL